LAQPLTASATATVTSVKPRVRDVVRMVMMGTPRWCLSIVEGKV
jgi:hypothetical protein